MPFYDRLRSELEARKQAGNYRELPLVSFNRGAIIFDSVRYLDLSSNDYLCIARDPKFFQTFISTMTDTSSSGSVYAEDMLLGSVGAGSSGSRLLTGNNTAYAYCEELLASLYNGGIACRYDYSSESSEDKAEVFHPYHKSNSKDKDVYYLHADDAVASVQTKNNGADGFSADYQLSEQFAEEAAVNAAVAAAAAAAAARPSYRKCLYFNSGFEANLGVISTLFGEHDLLLVDKLAHASIIDGMLSSKAKTLRFAHNNVEHLESLIAKHYQDYESVVIVTESVFSMEGDLAPLQQLVELKKRYPNVLLYVDEAHSFGLFGEDGLGLCKELGVHEDVDFLVGTLSKAIGSQGAFLICAPEVKEYLVNFMRPLIFSTALPPVNVTFSMYVIGLLKTTAMQYKREYLRKISDYLHSNLQDLGIVPSQSQIQPLITGDSDKALMASHIFRRAGMLALPIRYPTVPQKQARLRLALNCNLRIDDIDLITRVIKRYRHLFV